MEKVLIITTNSGFVPQFEMNDVRILKENGYQIHYASNFEKPIYEIDTEALKKQGLILHHVNIEKSPVHMLKNTKALKRIAKIIDEEKIDLVHCHNPIGGVLGRLAAKFSDRKPSVIYTAHGFHFYKGAPIKNWLIYYTVERWLARYTDIIITINREDFERAKKFRLRVNGKVEQIHGVGVDLQKFKKRSGFRQKKRTELEVPQEAFHIVSVAELNANKNQKVIIEAIARMKKKKIFYSICGEGKNLKNLQKLVKKYQLQERVRLLGYRTDVDEVLQTADCFAFPSIREGLGIAAVEAIACEVPVIASDNRGTREYMIHGKNGIICPYGKVDDFEAAICMLYENPQLCAEMAANCREIAQPFAINETDKEMRRIYAMFGNAKR